MVKNKVDNGRRNQGKKQQTADTTKPKFDKKKWREKKYSMKYKVNEWEKRREKAVIKQYYKELKKDPLYSQNLIKQKPTDSPQTEGASESAPQPSFSSTTSTNFKDKRKKLNSYDAAKAEMKRIKEERDKQREEKLKKKKEMEASLAEYKKKRAERYRILSKKNQRGQPVMKGRLESLYEQIKQSIT